MKKTKNKQRIIHPHKLSITEQILLILKKTVDTPFEILLEYGKLRNQSGFGAGVARSTLNRLRKKSLIHFERRGRNVYYTLTEGGEKVAAKIKIKLDMTKPKKWDGKWRIIVFDIPEKFRGKRDLLRHELINFGFKQFQKSVWAYPHTLPNDFLDLWREAGILQHCLIFEASDVTGNANFKK